MLGFKDHKKILNHFFDFTFSVDALMTRDFKISCENQIILIKFVILKCPSI